MSYQKTPSPEVFSLKLPSEKMKRLFPEMPSEMYLSTENEGNINKSTRKCSNML